MSRTITLCLLTSAVALVLCLSVVALSSRETEADVVAAVTDETSDTASAAETPVIDPPAEINNNSKNVPRQKPEIDAADDVTFTYAGSVVDERGQPVVGAKIALGDLRANADEPDAKKPESKTPTASEKASATPAAISGAATTQVTVSGVVLTPDGKPAAGATVRAAAPLWTMLAPIVGADFKSPMSETKADAQGRFSISFPTQPFGDVSQLDERWREIWKKTAVAASLAGFGPAWVTYDEIDPQEPVTLKLVDDVPIRGRVVDLEGRPVAGAKIKLSEALRAAKGDDLSAWIEGIKAGELPWTVVDKAPRFVELRLLGLPDLLTTDAKGMFELHGLGRERCLPLTFEGEFVAYRNAMVVTRNMPALRRTISNPPFEGFEPVFGSEFTFTADPARTIEGVVRDAQSGELLAGVSVESYKLIGYPYSNHRVLKAKTDKLGQFRLIGMPKGSGNRLLLVPNDDQPPSSTSDRGKKPCSRCRLRKSSKVWCVLPIRTNQRRMHV